MNYAKSPQPCDPMLMPQRASSPREGRSWRWARCFALSSLLLVVGCGDSGSSTPTESGDLTKAGNTAAMDVDTSKVGGGSGTSNDSPIPPGGMELPVDLDLTNPGTADPTSAAQEPAFQLPD